MPRCQMKNARKISKKHKRSEGQHSVDSLEAVSLFFSGPVGKMWAGLEVRVSSRDHIPSQSGSGVITVVKNCAIVSKYIQN